MTIRQQVTIVLGSIQDEEIRSRVRFSLAVAFHNRKGWVKPLEYDREWAGRAMARIIKGHGEEPCL